MSDLLTLAYEATPPAPWRALPAKWDGRLVDWEEMEPAKVYICPPAPADTGRCERCHSTAQRRTWRGVVWCKPGDFRTQQAQTRSRRTYWRDHEVVDGERLVFDNIHAFRCPDCGLDTVLELDSGAEWVLDEFDYGPEGSMRP